MVTPLNLSFLGHGFSQISTDENLMLDAGYSACGVWRVASCVLRGVLAAGCWMPDAGYSMPDAGCRMLDPGRSRGRLFSFGFRFLNPTDFLYERVADIKYRIEIR
jgi:hypothetical protein